MFWRKDSPEVLEARIIKAARQNLHYGKRWGRYWILYYLIAISLVTALIVMVGNLIAAIVKNRPANALEFWFGLIVGTLVGAGFHKAIGAMVGFARTLLPDERDRLLVRYHDALREVLDSSSETAAETAVDQSEDVADSEPERHAPLDHCA